MTQTPQTSSPTPSEPPHPAETGAVLILGEEGGLGAALLRRFEQSGSPAASALDLTDGQAAEMLREGNWRAVAVVTRDDAQALRLTLLSAHVRPDLPLWVTMFDQTVSRELQHVASKVNVLSPRRSSPATSPRAASPKPARRSLPAAVTASAWSTTRSASSSPPPPASSSPWRSRWRSR